MMKKKRHTAKFKSTVALDAAKEAKTLNELASQHGVYPAQISEWKKTASRRERKVYSTTRKKKIQAYKNKLMSFIEQSVKSPWNVIG